MSKIEQEVLDKIFLSLKDLGCCHYCSLRFSSVIESKPYTNYEFSKNGSSSENGVAEKLVKVNPCVACLGILQPPFFDNAVEEIIKKIQREGYESDTFNMAVTLPISYQIRSQSMWYYIMDKFPEQFKTMFPFGCVTVGAKDVTKWIVAPLIEQKTGMKFDAKSDFIINVSGEYRDEGEECACLFKLFPETFKKNKKKGVMLSNISRKSVEDKFTNVLCDDEFKQEYPCPPSIPNSFATLDSVSLAHNSIFVAGRYRKLSRSLPQTPWIVGSERKMESSVQEKITCLIEKFFKTQMTKFGASGREDVDVRMLGRGRPFTVELINPRKTKISFDQMRSLESEINSTADEQISVQHLQIVPKTCLVDLKAGEEDKCKVYEALCAVSIGFTDKMEKISDLVPIELDQMTPIRVLHRRPVASRKRVIYSLKTSSVAKKSPIDGTQLVKVELKTQAGTYVKEFIHGDLGRTKPSLQSLTEAPFVDIIALDVKDIELDWPPPVEYNEK